MRYELDECVCDISYDNNGSVLINGSVKNYSPNSTLIFWAASPPDYRTSYTGSGLPYPNYEIAYENTPNKGTVPIVNGSFTFNIRYPSGYYAGLGSAYVKPHLNLQINSMGKLGPVSVVSLGEGIPFRLLTYPPIPETAPRTSPAFYDVRHYLPVRTQEQILRDSDYPNNLKMPANFWGLRPSEP